MTDLVPTTASSKTGFFLQPFRRDPSLRLRPRRRCMLAALIGAVFLTNLLLPDTLPFIASAQANGDLALNAATSDPASVAAPGAKAVTNAAEIRAKLDNVTIYGRYIDNGDQWVEYHLADGRTAYWEKGCTWPGKWWITDDGEVCYAYPNYRDNAPNCFIMFVRPDGGVQFVSIGDTGQAYLASDSTKIAPGNDAHLPVGGISPCVGA